MKQLFIVKSSAALNGGKSAPNALDSMTAGSIGFYHLDTPGSWLSAAPTKDFAIAFGRGANSPAIVFPEVDFKTLSINVAAPSTGTAFTATITIPTTVVGKTYTIVLVKKGTVPHERNTWTATETVYDATKQTAAVIAAKLGAYFERMAIVDPLNITVSVSGAAITITAVDKRDQFTVKLGDDLYGATVTSGQSTVSALSETPAAPPVGDKAYIQFLASECAENRGFSDTYRDGDTIYPAYPMEVEDKQYTVYTLRFAVGRKSAKTRDERVWQLVHVAVPTDATAKTTIATILAAR